MSQELSLVVRSIWIPVEARIQGEEEEQTWRKSCIISWSAMMIRIL